MLKKLINTSFEKINLNSNENFSISKASTPMIYQALVNILHYKCHYNLPESLKIFIDDGNKYYNFVSEKYKYADCEGNEYECEYDGKAINKAPEELLKVNSHEYLEVWVKDASNTAAANEIAKLTKKYNFTENEASQTTEIINKMFSKCMTEETPNLVDLSKDLREIIINNRIQKYLTDEQKQELSATYGESFKQALENADSNSVSCILENIGVDAKISGRISKNFNKFLEVSDNNEKLLSRIEDLTKSEMHHEIAQEIRIFNQIKEFEFEGHEFIYRGLRLPEDFDIEVLFESNPRPLNGHGSFLDYHVINENSGNITTDLNAVISTSWNFEVSKNFAINNPYVGGENYCGYVLDIRPKAAEKGVLMANYEVITGFYECEVAYENIMIEDIYAIYKVTENFGDEKAYITDAVYNPHYVKRAADNITKTEFSAGDTLSYDENGQCIITHIDNTKTEYDPLKDWILKVCPDFHSALEMNDKCEWLNYSYYSCRGIDSETLAKLHAEIYAYQLEVNYV